MGFYFVQIKLDVGRRQVEVGRRQVETGHDLGSAPISPACDPGREQPAPVRRLVPRRENLVFLTQKDDLVFFRFTSEF